MMKYFITVSLLVLAFFGRAQSSYISTDNPIILKPNGITVIEAGAYIYVTGTYDIFSDTWVVSFKVSAGSGIVPLPDTTTRLDGSYVDSLYGTVSDTLEIQTALEQALIEGYLEGLNPGTTFTIH
jgi:hypothetical protein